MGVTFSQVARVSQEMATPFVEERVTIIRPRAAASQVAYNEVTGRVAGAYTAYTSVATTAIVEEGTRRYRYEPGAVYPEGSVTLLAREDVFVTEGDIVIHGEDRYRVEAVDEVFYGSVAYRTARLIPTDHEVSS